MPISPPGPQYPELTARSAAWGCGSVDGRQLFYTSGVEASGRNPVEGFKSTLVFYPDDDLTIVLLENLDTVDAFTIANAVAYRVLAE